MNIFKQIYTDETIMFHNELVKSIIDWSCSIRIKL